MKAGFSVEVQLDFGNAFYLFIVYAQHVHVQDSSQNAVSKSEVLSFLSDTYHLR